jgi:CrcB protein
MTGHRTRSSSGTLRLRAAFGRDPGLGKAAMMNGYLVVALGSAIGGALRHGVNVGSARFLGTGWPWGTFTVNVVGSFTVGIIAAYFALAGHASQTWRLLLVTGILGGFTTFSAFSLDVALLWERGQVGRAALYAGGSVVLSIGALFLGLAIVRRLVHSS